jgi:hypothetical protein
MKRDDRKQPCRTGAIVRAVGLVLIGLALALQGLLPLADARWHAAQGRGLGERIALRGGVTVRSTERKPVPLPTSADHACQFCIALQTPAALPPSDGTLAAPIAYNTIALPPVAAAAPSPPPTERHQPRAPPIRA